MIQMKNNFIMALLKLGYSDQTGTVKQRHIDFYKRRAKHVGAVTLEPLYIDKGLRELPTQLGIESDEKIQGLFNLVNIIHSEGAKVIAHLNHPGRLANPKIPGNYFVSSSDKACPSFGKVPAKMTKEDIQKAISLFSEAAKRVEKAGFDMLELQFGHGHLVAQFMSPEINDRNDEYGGSFENRIRFGIEVLQAVKNSVNIPIIIRLSADEIVPNGIKLPEVKKFAKELEKNGADALHIIAGSLCTTPPWFFQHMFIPKGKTWEFAKEIKKEVNIPIIFVGQINSFEDIDNLIKNYDADYIAVGRALVADPDFIGKYLGKVSGVYRPCMACSDGCLGGVKSGKGLGCLANPQAGKDDLFEIKKSDETKKIAIIGAGLAGMEAALELNKKGYIVDIYEKDKIGGQFNYAYLPPKKQNLKRIIEYYKKALAENNIQITKREITADEILDKKYDEVIIATGSKPAVPPIPGLDNFNWAEILEKDIQHKKIVIIGGGLIGIEVAHALLHKNNNVIIVEMLSEVARGMEGIEKALTMKSLKEANVPIYLDSKVTKIEGDKVYVSAQKDFVIENVDEIVIATGMKSYHPLAEQLEDKIPVHLIGDANKVAKAQDAIKAGFELAKTI